MSSTSNTPPEDYFNDLSQPISNSEPNRHQRRTAEMTGTAEGDPMVPKPKRIACIICRKRKLKCDGSKPSCSTCTRLGHNCAYDPVRKKSGPKRGYVKALEERLKQVETMLKTQEPPTTSANPSNTTSGAGLQAVPAPDLSIPSPSIGVESDQWRYNHEAQPPLNDINIPNMNMGMGLDDTTFSWEMIGLGVEEPLPLADVVDELHQIYFDSIHPSLPMIHKYRYLAAMNLAPNQRPPVALRYAMWTLAASTSEKYFDLKEHFYQRARKYMEIDILKGFGEHAISIGHAQTHILLASYEFKMMYFPRAWMSTGAAIRLCQMMGLHRLDGVGLDVKQCLPPPRDWTEREERRRTFWMAFCEDRYASIGTGWPMTVDERDILSDLPASEEAFALSKPERTQTLNEAMSKSGASKLSAFAGVVLMACLFGRNLIHLHRPDDDDRDHDLNGEFWKRHRHMDNILLNTALNLPFHLRLPHGLANPNIVFANMNIHSSAICLHQAAIYKAEKNRLPSSVSAESKKRAISAANETTNIMRMISHMDLSSMNPFISFCLYVAARVFIQYLKSVPTDSQCADSLRFLLSAMNALKKKNPLTESFLVQLDVDLEGLGMRNNEKYKGVFGYDPDYLGIASAKVPIMGTNAKAEKHTNECHFMRYAGDIEYDLDPERSSPIPATAEPGTAGPAAVTNSFPQDLGAEQNWAYLSDHPQPQSLHMIKGRGLVVNQGSHIARDINNYNHEGSSNGGESGLSPNTGPSNQATPNSTTPSDSRSSNNLQQHGQKTSDRSYETSPAPPPPQNPNHTLDSFFTSRPDFNNIPSTGMTPGPFSMAETPGSWSLGGGHQGSGLTPVGEGVFRHMMGMGPLDPMDIWEGNS